MSSSTLHKMLENFFADEIQESIFANLYYVILITTHRFSSLALAEGVPRRGRGGESPSAFKTYSPLQKFRTTFWPLSAERSYLRKYLISNFDRPLLASRRLRLPLHALTYMGNELCQICEIIKEPRCSASEEGFPGLGSDEILISSQGGPNSKEIVSRVSPWRVLPPINSRDAESRR